jgi:hypothetical protein
MRRIVLPVVLFVFFLVLFLHDLGSLRNYHGDEGYWCHVGNTASHRFFVKQDFSDPFWTSQADTDSLTWVSNTTRNPKVSAFLIGASLHFFGYAAYREELHFDFSKSLAWNLEQGEILPPGVLYAARLPMALSAAITCLLLFFVGKRLAEGLAGGLAGGLCGALSSLLLALNPAWHQLTTRAMIDSPAVMFSVATLLCVLCFSQCTSERSAVYGLFWSILTGMAAGLAAGSKLNGLLMIPFLVGAFALQGIGGQRIYLRVASALVSILVALGVFVALHPLLWHSTLENLRHILHLGAEVADYYRVVWAKVALTNLGDKALFVLYRSFFTHAILTSRIGLPLDLLLSAVGLTLLGWYARTSITIRLVLLYGGIVTTGTWLWIPADWDRYYLPMFPLVALTEAYALTVGFSWARENMGVAFCRR